MFPREALLLLVCACSSNEAAMDAAVDALVYRDGAQGNCVKPGTPNNDQGVGGYCETAADCPMALCTGLFGAPSDAWFCSKLCAMGQPCGAGAICASDPRGVACVPIQCIGDASAADAHD